MGKLLEFADMPAVYLCHDRNGFQVEPRQTLQQAEVAKLGELEHPPVQHGRGQLFGDRGPTP